MANTLVQQINEEMEELQKQLSQFKSSVEYLNNAKSNVTMAVDAVNKAEAKFNKGTNDLEDSCQSLVGLSDALLALVQKIDTVNFPERLDNIQVTVKETIKNLNEVKKATISEVQKAASVITEADFDGRFTKLQKSIDFSVKSNRELATEITNLQIPEKIDEFEKSVTRRIAESYKEIEKNTKQIADDTSKAILNLNLPIRIDKLDANIAGISSAIQNVQGRLDLVESNVKDRLRESSEKQAQALNTFQEKMMNAFEKLNNDNILRQKKQQVMNIVTIAVIIITFLVLFFVNH